MAIDMRALHVLAFKSHEILVLSLWGSTFLPAISQSESHVLMFTWTRLS
jgi:hypothetical protein